MSDDDMYEAMEVRERGEAYAEELQEEIESQQRTIDALRAVIAEHNEKMRDDCQVHTHFDCEIAHKGMTMSRNEELREEASRIRPDVHRYGYDSRPDVMIDILLEIHAVAERIADALEPTEQEE